MKKTLKWGSIGLGLLTLTIVVGFLFLLGNYRDNNEPMYSDKPLSYWIESGSRQEQKEAAMAIGKEAVQKVANLLKTTDNINVKRMCMLAITEHEPSPESPVPAIIHCLRTDESIAAKKSAVEFLMPISIRGSFYSARAKMELVNTLLDESTEVSEAAADCLGRIGSERVANEIKYNKSYDREAALQTLINALSRDSPKVKNMAAIILGDI